MSLQMDFIPKKFTVNLSKSEKIKFILERVMDDRIILLEEGLAPTEQLDLVSETMKNITFDEFTGIEVITFNGANILQSSKRGIWKKKSETKMTMIAPSGKVSSVQEGRNITTISLRV